VGCVGPVQAVCVCMCKRLTGRAKSLNGPKMRTMA
jgi:hypothetical protein